MRTAAREAIAKIGDIAQDLVPALTEELRDDDVKLRLEAATALGDLGAAAKKAIPDLKRAADARTAELERGGDAGEAAAVSPSFPACDGRAANVASQSSPQRTALLLKTKGG